MSRKNNLLKYKLISEGDMSGDIVSPVTNVQFLDNIAIQAVWSGTSPVGTISVEVSIDYAEDNQGNVINAGNWVAIDLDPVPAVSGNTGSDFIDINQLSAPWIRVKYTAGSGVGDLDVYVSAKQL